ncbi:MAG: DNA polymerase III subunit alpha [Armatimonas sp.]
MRHANGFGHLHTHSAFSFGSGPSSITSLVLRVAELGQPFLALTDTNSVTGIPELVRRCEKSNIQPIGGCEVVLEGGSRLTLLANGPIGFSSLCQLLSSAGMRDIERKGLRVRWEELARYSKGVFCLTGASPWGVVPRLILRRCYQEAEHTLQQLVQIYGFSNIGIEIVRSRARWEHSLTLHLFDLADKFHLPPIATNGANFGVKAEFLAHEALCRARLGIPIDQEHGLLPLNGERYLKGTMEMADLFADRPDAIQNAVTLAEQLEPPLAEKARHYPRYRQLPRGENATECLSGLTWAGAKQQGLTGGDAIDRIKKELNVISRMKYCDYFLICRQVIQETRARGIGCALRGSAIGSAVLYALGVSTHDPIERRVSFERFLSMARKKPPDIDIDFEHDKRDQMQQWLRDTFGQDHVANVCNYVTYRGRSLLRDIGKVLGFDGPEMERLRELLWHSSGENLAERVQSLPELKALNIDVETYSDLFALCGQLARNPRHLSTHSSGIVVSDVPICEVAPVLWADKGVPIVALDKDDVESPGIGFLKMDQLCLRALTAIEIAKTSLPENAYEERKLEDDETFAMLRTGDTIGTFQLESPAQIALQWRLKAEKFDDLVHAVALVRPGPLIGGGVGPYVAVRHGHRKPYYPIPKLAEFLDDTYGRILFQDQALDVIRVVGDLPPDEADKFLKQMAHTRSREEMGNLGRELREHARAKGILSDKEFSKLWKQIEGFSRFGFCHGHSVAFATHAQGTAWLLRHHPAEFLAAVLSVEPCGFWPISTLVEEAKRRGVEVHGPCLNRSRATLWSVEETESKEKAIRCSLSYVKGVSEELAEWLIEERENQGDFQGLRTTCQRLGFVPRESLEWLILAGALDSISLSRRRALWSLPALHRAPDISKPTQPGQGALPVVIIPSLPPELPDFRDMEREHQEWQALGFSPMGHPIRHHREDLNAQGVRPCGEIMHLPHDTKVTMAGISIRPHRPPVPSGQIVVFLSLEDETGIVQVTVPTHIYEIYGHTLFTEPRLRITGTVAKRGAGNILIASQVEVLPRVC